MAVTLPEFTPTEPGEPTRDVRSISAAELTVRIVAGRATMTMAEVQALAPGSIVPLDTTPDSPVSVMVNDVKAARADIIVVDDKLAARVSEMEQQDDG